MGSYSRKACFGFLSSFVMLTEMLSYCCAACLLLVVGGQLGSGVGVASSDRLNPTHRTNLLEHCGALAVRAHAYDPKRKLKDKKGSDLLPGSLAGYRR